MDEKPKGKVSEIHNSTRTECLSYFANFGLILMRQKVFYSDIKIDLVVMLLFRS